jgi:hypothetical protein
MDSQGNFTPSTIWKFGPDGQSACYADLVPVISGAGHKPWQYTLTPTPWYDSISSSSVVTLPSNKGSVSLALFDSNGSKYGDSGFGTNATRNFTIQLQAIDPDQDNWYYEIDKITQTQSSDGSLFTTSHRLSGTSMTYYPYSGGYTVQTIPVTLSAGDQGDPSDPSLTFSYTYADVILHQQSGGTYSISVTDLNGNPALSSASAIITRPGELLSFSVDPPSGTSSQVTYSWDFGDGTAAGNLTSVTHAYAQVPGQTTDRAPHTVTITVNDGTNTTQIPLSVLVIDTQEGPLLTNETWVGDHTVTGVVEIPANLTLTIIPSSSSSLNVSFAGGLADGFSQGLLVDSGGTLNISDNVLLHPFSGQTGGWGTILVSGTATVGQADITGADRGLTANDGSVVSLTNTSLHGNAIGLHVLGTSVTTATGLTIVNNSVYGVKEDNGGRPILVNSTIRSNFRNYYSWDQGLLNIIAVNGLLNNSGNQGE